MCLTNALIYILRICYRLRLNRITDTVISILQFTPLYSTIFIIGFITCFVLSLAYHKIYLIYVLILVSLIIFVVPVVVSSLRLAVNERKTHGVETQRFQVGFIADPDPQAPLLTAAEQMSIIRIPEPTAVWNTEPLRQQPVLDQNEVREFIYKRMENTRRPRCDKPLTPSSNKEGKTLPSRGRQMCSTSIPRRRTRSSSFLDNQQPGTSHENPCVVNIVPDIQYEPPTDTSESSETVDEAERDSHLLSALPYGTVRRSRKIRHDSTLRVAESGCDTPAKQFPDEKHKDSKYSRIKKRLGIPDTASAIEETTKRTEKSLLKPESSKNYTFSLSGPSFEQTDEAHTESVSQTKISSSEHDCLDTEDRSPSRSSDTGTAETTLSDKSESPGSSRHSSPGDGEKTPKFGDSPTLHVSRRSRKNS